MAVRIFLTSGAQRMVETADVARANGPFFEVTCRHAPSGQVHTVLTLLTKDVIAAEVVQDGVVTDYVMGGGKSSN
jgi:predicted homoserine dehydrogenase-like protein